MKSVGRSASEKREARMIAHPDRAPAENLNGMCWISDETPLGPVSSAPDYTSSR
jgi:hypothetical protein